MTKKSAPLIFRQGDVLLRAVTAIPDSAKPLAHKGRVVLAEGEVTGHAHAFYEGRVRMFRDDGLGRTFIRVEAGGGDAMLKHEEHSTIPVPAGDYELLNQLQYTPAEIQRVAD
jgi:hypothetical protein